MAIDLMMPALSPTMEKGTLAKWLVGVGDMVKPGDLLAEIETDKATMEFEAVDEGRIGELVIAEGTDDIPVGTVIARLLDGAAAATTSMPDPPLSPSARRAVRETGVDPASLAGSGKGGRLTREDVLTAAGASRSDVEPAPAAGGGEVAQAQPVAAVRPVEDAEPAHPPLRFEAGGQATPLARRLALAKGLDLGAIHGTGSAGRVTLDDVAPRRAAPAMPAAVPGALPDASGPASSAAPGIPDVPREAVRLTTMRKTIARRLTESKQQVPHIYLTVDVRLDALLKLRADLNASLESRGVKLSVNDLMIKAQALALLATPACNVQYTPDTLIRFTRADIAVAVSVPDGLITPVIADAGGRSLSSIAGAMGDLAERARANQLRPHEYQGGTASLSNLGMFGIRQFAAVINPPHAMILAIGAAERRALVADDAVGIATIVTITGSFDHRAIDGADAARFMNCFRELAENPLNILA